MGVIENIRRELWRHCTLPTEPVVWYAGRNGTCRRELPSPRDRFIDSIRIGPGWDECFIWCGLVNQASGNGVFKHAGKPHAAHRLAYEMWTDTELSDKDILLHTCGEMLCVNHRHLQLSTRQEMRAEMMVLMPDNLRGQNFSSHKEPRIRQLVTRAGQLGHPHIGAQNRKNMGKSRAMYSQLREEFPDIERSIMHNVLTDKTWLHIPRPWPDVFKKTVRIGNLPERL